MKYVLIPEHYFTRHWVCRVVRSGFHNGATCNPNAPHGNDWNCGYRVEVSFADATWAEVEQYEDQAVTVRVPTNARAKGRGVIPTPTD